MNDVLEQRPHRLADIPDLVRGALDAHLHFRPSGVTSSGKSSMSRRQIGWLAILGGTLWIVAYLGVHLVGLMARALPRGMAAGEGSTFLLSLLVAPACLVLAQAAIIRSTPERRHWWWSASLVVSTLGASLMTTGLLVDALLPDRPLVDDLSPLGSWLIGMLVLLVGSFAFGALGLATAVVSRRYTAILLCASFLNVAALLASTAGFMTSLRYSSAVAFAGVLFGLSWVALGAELLRRTPPASPGRSGTTSNRSVSSVVAPAPVPEDQVARITQAPRAGSRGGSPVMLRAASDR